jgi:hypothetical protein
LSRLVFLLILIAIFGCDHSSSISEQKIDFDSTKAISLEDALVDLRMFDDLIKFCYSGYDVHLEMGLDFDNRIVEVEKELRNDDTILLGEFFELLASITSGVKDNHLVLKADEKYIDHGVKYGFWPSSIAVEWKGNEYVVYQSNLDEVPLGAKYLGPTEYLFLIDPKHSAKFRLGTLAQNQSSIVVDFSSGKQELLTHNPYRRMNTSRRNYLFNIRDDYAYLAIRSFSQRDEGMEEFIHYGETLRSFDLIVLDLRGNHGGQSNFMSEFLYNLNDTPTGDFASSGETYLLISKKMNEIYRNRINSDFVCQFSDDQLQKAVAYLDFLELTLSESKSDRTWYQTGNEICFPDIGINSFKGNLIVLIDKNTASSAEGWLPLLASKLNATIVGENSAGAGLFASQDRYVLENSGIEVFLSNKYVPGWQNGTKSLARISHRHN